MIMRRGRGDESSRRVQQESRVSLWSPRAWLNVVDLYKRRAHHKTASVRALYQSTSVGHTTPVSSEHLRSMSPNTHHLIPTSSDHHQPPTSSDYHQASTLTFADHETSTDYQQTSTIRTSTVIGYPVTFTTGIDHPLASINIGTTNPLASTITGTTNPLVSTITGTDHTLDSNTGTTNQASTIKDRQQASTFSDQYHDFTTASYNQVAFTSEHWFSTFSSQDETLFQYQLDSEGNVISEQNAMTSSGDVDLAIDQHPTDLPFLQHQAGTTRNQLSDTISDQHQIFFLIADMNSNVQQATNLSVQQTDISSSKLQTSTYGVQQHSSDATFIIQTTSTITPFLHHKPARSEIQHKILESANVQHETSTPSSFQQKIAASSSSGSQHTTPTLFGFQHKISSLPGSQHKYSTSSSSQVKSSSSSTSQRVSPSSFSTQQHNSGTQHKTASSFRVEHKTVRTQHLPRANQVKDVTSKRSQVTPTTPRTVVRPMHVISVKDGQKTWRHDVTSHNKTLVHHRDYHSINSALGKTRLLLTFFKMSATNCSPCCIRLLQLLFCNIYVQHHATLHQQKFFVII